MTLIIELSLRRDCALRLSGELADGGLSRPALITRAIMDIRSPKLSPVGQRGSMVRVPFGVTREQLKEIGDRQSELRNAIERYLLMPIDDLRRYLDLWEPKLEMKGLPQEDDAHTRATFIRAQALKPLSREIAPVNTGMVLDGDEAFFVEAPPIPIRTPIIDWSVAGPVQSRPQPAIKPAPAEPKRQGPAVIVREPDPPPVKLEPAIQEKLCPPNANADPGLPAPMSALDALRLLRKGHR